MLLFTLLATAKLAHPVHAARVALDATASGAVRLTVRVFRDDFPPGDAIGPVANYLGQHIVINDAGGKPIALTVAAIGKEGDRLRIDLTGQAANSLTHGRLAVTLLQERYPDQVNVVVIHLAGHDAQLVFLKGDGPQKLP